MRREELVARQQLRTEGSREPTNVRSSLQSGRMLQVRFVPIAAIPDCKVAACSRGRCVCHALNFGPLER